MVRSFTRGLCTDVRRHFCGAPQPKWERTNPPVQPPASTFAHTVAAVGLVETSTENIAIGAHLPGVVEKVFVTVGDSVRAGAPLFKIDDRHLRAQLAQAQAAEQ